MSILQKLMKFTSVQKCCTQHFKKNLEISNTQKVV